MLAQVLNAEATATFEIAGAVVSGMTSKVRSVGEDWMLPLSSTARTRTVVDPSCVNVAGYVQVSRPAAGCQVAPPSVETSIAATRPPLSVAVPVIVIGWPT